MSARFRKTPIYDGRTAAVAPFRQPGHDVEYQVCLRLSKQVDLNGQDGAREDACEQLVHRADLIVVFMQGPEEKEAPLFPLDPAAVR